MLERGTHPLSTHLPNHALLLLGGIHPLYSTMHVLILLFTCVTRPDNLKCNITVNDNLQAYVSCVLCHRYPTVRKSAVDTPPPSDLHPKKWPAYHCRSPIMLPGAWSATVGNDESPECPDDCKLPLQFSNPVEIDRVSAGLCLRQLGHSRCIPMPPVTADADADGGGGGGGGSGATSLTNVVASFYPGSLKFNTSYEFKGLQYLRANRRRVENAAARRVPVCIPFLTTRPSQLDCAAFENVCSTRTACSTA